jgi:hypothetical protein
VRVDDVVRLLDDIAIVGFDACAFQQARDLRDEAGRVERGFEIVVRPGLQSFEGGRGVFAARADQEHGRQTEARIPAQAAAQFDAVEVRHHDIADDERGEFAAREFESFEAVDRRQDAVAGLLQHDAGERERVGRVVDDEDGGFRLFDRHGRSCLPRGRLSSGLNSLDVRRGLRGRAD